MAMSPMTFDGDDGPLGTGIWREDGLFRRPKGMCSMRYR
jgi:hypothetical protein